MVKATEQSQARFFYQCLIHWQISGCLSCRHVCWARRYSTEPKLLRGSRSVGQTGINRRPRKIKMKFVLGGVSCGIRVGDF